MNDSRQIVAGRRAPLTPEMVRILMAAECGALMQNAAGRWVIQGGDRPDPSARRKLKSRGYLTDRLSTTTEKREGGHGLYRAILTPAGERMMRGV